MATYTHPNASKVIVSTRLETPHPGIPYRVLVVEANIHCQKTSKDTTRPSWEACSICIGHHGKSASGKG